MSKKKVVLDTNILLVSISKKSKYHWVFEKLLKAEFELCITTEILNEYEEIISNKYNEEVAKDVIKMLLLLPNIEKIEVYYKWDLIKNDRDDNKFCDCAIAANADFIVTHDKHFKVLENVDFPKITTIKIKEFYNLINRDRNHS